MIHRTDKGLALQEAALLAFLNEFVQDTENPDHRFPGNIEDVFNDICTLWDEHGFIPPGTLRHMLLEEYLAPNERKEKIIELSKTMERVRGEARDPLSKLQHRTEYPIAQALAYQWVHHHNDAAGSKPRAVHELVIDLQNMDLGNKHARAMLANERGVDVTQVPVQEAYDLCDRVNRVMLQFAVHVLKKHFPELSWVGNPLGSKGKGRTGARIGGDEFALLVFNADEELLNKCAYTIQLGFAHLAANLGFDGYAPPDNQNKRGAGGGIAGVSYADPDFDPETYIFELDKIVDKQKGEWGLRRNGKVPGLEKVEISLKLSPELRSKVAHSAPYLERKKDLESFAGTLVKQFARVGNGSFAAMIEDRLRKTERMLLGEPVEEKALSPQQIKEEEAKTQWKNLLEQTAKEVPPFATPEDIRIEAMLLAFANDTDLKEIDETEIFALVGALEALSPKHPVTGSDMLRDLPQTLARWNEKCRMLNADKPPEEHISIYARGVTMAGFRAGNNKFGHDGVDKIQRHMVHEMKKILDDYGFKPDEHYIDYTGEGGQQIFLLKPDAEIDWLRWDQAFVEIATFGEALNNTAISEICKKLDIVLGPFMASWWNDRTLGEISGKKNPHHKGMPLVVTDTMEIDPSALRNNKHLSGGEIMADIKEVMALAEEAYRARYYPAPAMPTKPSSQLS